MNHGSHGRPEDPAETAQWEAMKHTGIDATHTVRFEPIVTRRWLRWHAKARVQRAWHEPCYPEFGHTYTLDLGTYWRREAAIQRTRQWCASAEHWSKRAGHGVIQLKLGHGV